MKRAVFWIACVLAVAGAVPALAGEGRGTVVAISGQVLATPPGGAAAPLRIGDTVEEGAVVETGPDATVKFAFDRAVLSIREGTRFELSRYYFSDDTGIVETLIRLTKGLIRSQVRPNLGPGSSFQIATWNTIAGVKGTDFSVETLEGKFSACYVFEGTLEMKNAAGQARSVSAGEMARAEGPDGKVTTAPLPAGVAGEKRVMVKEEPRSAALSGGARARAIAGIPESRGPSVSGIPSAGKEANPQVNVTGNQPISPKGLSVPSLPGSVSPSAPVPPPAPAAPSVPSERSEGLPF